MRSWSLPAAAELGSVNLFDEPLLMEQVSSGGSIDPETGLIPPDQRAALHRRMNSLARRVVSESETMWHDSLTGSAGPSADNPHIPAGYTYLLQLIGHDLVDSSPLLLPVSKAGPSNARVRPLMLDTIYGAGPDAFPLAYDGDTGGDAFRNEHGRLPRRFLRTAGLDRAGLPRQNWFCPFADLARIGVPSADGRGELTDALIVDPRNDAHALMSQMTVLFHVAHNAIYRTIAAATDNLSRTDQEMSRRIFACSRAILTLIYRRIVRFDALPLILDQNVMALYGETTRPLKPFRGVPAEFSAGAFRFGHAMVRRDYVFNAGRPPGTGPGFAALNSRRAPHHMPLGAPWMVDWAFFFDLRNKVPDAPTPNLSRRIGPRYSNVLDIDPLFLKRSEHDGTGLSYRDYRSSIYAGQWRVADLAALLSGHLDRTEPGLGARLAPEFGSRWQPLIRQWLGAGGAFAGQDCEIDRLSADPPWPFFVLFEAAFRDSGTGPDSTGMGQTLGPVGSLVAAETIIGALAATEVVQGEWQCLGAAVRNVCQTCLGSETAVAALSGPDIILPQDMASFLVFLADLGAFGPGS